MKGDLNAKGERQIGFDFSSGFDLKITTLSKWNLANGVVERNVSQYVKNTK